ncbi:MAG: 16S rRNA (cytosine(967)-C(5))-methyltransferase RsmB [Gammaproteobacteria bacterium]
MQARALAAEVLTEILTKRKTITAVLPARLEELSLVQDRAFVQELCYGVMRWYYRFSTVLASMMKRGLKPKHTDIKALIMIGLYQFDFLHVPEHAIVSATVGACDDIHKPWAKKLVNAILRLYQRERISLREQLSEDTGYRHAHPAWLIRELQHDFPQHWLHIIKANNQRPPMFLRINQRLTTRTEYLDKLNQAHIYAEQAPWSTVGIKLAQPVAVEYLPGFPDGLVSVQDLSAQLAAPLLEPHAGQRILDACAAPGGKLAHILESVNDQGDVVAVELVPGRIQKLNQTLERLRLQARVVEADALTPGSWWDGVQFDCILLDAPCSASGVIRRHPDIKFLRVEADLVAATRTQMNLLAALWPLLKAGGKLLYSTCSVLNCENDLQISEFIKTHQDARPDSIQAGWGRSTTFGRQILPGKEDMDGFYYARMEKV